MSNEKIDDKGKDTDDLEEEESEDSKSEDEASDDEASDNDDEASDEDADDEASDEDGDDEASDEDSDDEASEDEDDEDDDAAEGEDADGEEEVVAASIRHAHEERPRRHGAHDDHDEPAAEVEPAEDDDPQWWIPHVVLITLVLIGVFGFFGVFNKPARALLEKLNMLPPTLAAADVPHETPKPSTPSTTAKPSISAQPQRPPQAQGEFGAKHLLVMYKGGGRAPPTITRTKEEAKARAEEAQKKAKGGANFEELVKEYTDEPGAAARGGALPNWNRGRMVPAFQEAVDKMKVNEISPVVESDFGYHVIVRTK